MARSCQHEGRGGSAVGCLVQGPVDRVDRVGRRELVSKPFKIDGHLEDAWSSAARFENFAEFMPTHKVPAKVQTEGFIAHGKTDLYVAFVCHDPEIGKLRASMTDRDWF